MAIAAGGNWGQGQQEPDGRAMHFTLQGAAEGLCQRILAPAQHLSSGATFFFSTTARLPYCLNLRCAGAFSSSSQWRIPTPPHPFLIARLPLCDTARRCFNAALHLLASWLPPLAFYPQASQILTRFPSALLGGRLKGAASISSRAENLTADRFLAHQNRGAIWVSRTGATAACFLQVQPLSLRRQAGWC